MKAELMNETLHTLKTDKISSFFKYVRESEESLPTDGRLKTILKQNYQRFANYTQEVPQIENKALTQNDRETILMYAEKYPDFKDLFLESLEDDDLYPSNDWHKRFMRLLQSPKILGRLGQC